MNLSLASDDSDEHPVKRLRARYHNERHSDLNIGYEVIEESDNDAHSDSLTSSDESEVELTDQVWVPSSRYHSRTRKCPSTSNAVISRKRTYRFLKRVARSSDKQCKMRERWMNGIPRYTDEEILDVVCCKEMCFKQINLRFLRQKMKMYLQLSYQDRRRVLLLMVSSVGEFSFDNISVCSKFLEIAFHFSPQLQADVRRSQTPLSDHYTPNVLQSLSTGVPKLAEKSTNQQPLSLDSIILFLDRISRSTAESMPDRNQFHLPFFRTMDVYEIFTKEFSRLYFDETCPSYSYFMRIWRQKCSHIQVRKTSRFTKCTTCEHLRSAMVNAVRAGQPTDELLIQKRVHNEFVTRERREYCRKKEQAILRPKDFLSIIIDGADQTAFSIPHFTTSTKDQRGHGLKVHLIGLLKHGATNQLHLYTMTENHETGSNHIVEVVHRFLNKQGQEGPLPRKLFVQVDNCVRENKNKYFLGYLEWLVRRQVFESIEVGFLPVGHTHSDVDQAFSTTAERLRHYDAITIYDMEDQLSTCYNSQTIVTSLKEVANWSGLCEQEKCCQKIKHITMWRYFRFTSKKISDEDREVLSICQVRGSVDDQWRDLETDKGPQFLCFVPELSKMPPEILRAPTNFKQVTARISSEEGRITSDEKLKALYELRDEVYQDRCIKFHWNLESIVELRDHSLMINSDEESSSDEAHPNAHFSYPSGCFVAIKAGQSEFDLDFWVGKVLDSNKGAGDSSAAVMTLTVLWYTAYTSNNIYTSRYRPWIVNNTPWKTEISTCSIYVKFNSLTSTKHLPMLVRTHLRNSING